MSGDKNLRRSEKITNKVIKILKLLFVSDTCTALPSIDNLETEETFPVDYGTVVSVDCSTGYTLSGSSSITCEQGTTFNSVNEPVCNISKKTHYFFEKCGN